MLENDAIARKSSTKFGILITNQQIIKSWERLCPYANAFFYFINRFSNFFQQLAKTIAPAKTRASVIKYKISLL